MGNFIIAVFNLTRFFVRATNLISLRLAHLIKPYASATDNILENPFCDSFSSL